MDQVGNVLYDRAICAGIVPRMDTQWVTSTFLIDRPNYCQFLPTLPAERRRLWSHQLPSLATALATCAVRRSSRARMLLATYLGRRELRCALEQNLYWYAVGVDITCGRIGGETVRLPIAVLVKKSKRSWADRWERIMSLICRTHTLDIQCDMRRWGSIWTSS